MPYTSSTFTVSQSADLPNQVLLTDTAQGSDVLVTTRRLYLITYNGESALAAPLSGDGYINWPLSSPTLNPALKPKDWAVRILVLWVDAGGNTKYSASGYFSLDGNGRAGLYSVTQKQVANPAVLQDPNYLSGCMQLLVSLESAKNAAEVGGDLYKAQMALDNAKWLLDKQTLNF